MHAEGGPLQLARLTPNVIGTAQYAAPELMNEDLLESMKPDQRYLQVMTAVCFWTSSHWNQGDDWVCLVWTANLMAPEPPTLPVKSLPKAVLPLTATEAAVSQFATHT